MNTTTTRILTAGGVAGPLLWAATVLYFGAVRPGYDPVNQFISELAERGSTTEVDMRLIGFCLPGVLILLFGILLLSRSTPVAVGALVILHGIGRILAGAFPCDPGCPMTNGSLSQTIHNITAVVNVLTLPAAALLWGLNRWTRRRSSKFAWYSLTSALLGLLFLFLMVASRDTRHHVGLYQRLSGAITGLWLAALAVSMWPSRRSSSALSTRELARPA